MKRLLLVLALVALTAIAFSATRVMAQTAPWIDLSPYQGTLPPGTIEIPPDDVETFWAHIGWAGHEGELVHIDQVSWHWESSRPDGQSQVEQWLVQPSQYVQISQWFPWNVVHTVGIPSTLFAFQADVEFTDGQGGAHGPIWSNVVYKHITPEPSSAAALAIGAASLGGALWRRRRK